MQELRWYLEDFLDYPFPPRTDRAHELLGALGSWGCLAYKSILNSEVRRLLERGSSQGRPGLRLIIQSDDPRLLAWPWEALRRSEDFVLGQTLSIERRLEQEIHPVSVRRVLPTNCIRILMVTARPKEGDISYRSISQPLVALIQREGLAVEVDLLRPPTWQMLGWTLESRPDHYHILHFDGHGDFQPVAGSPIGTSQYLGSLLFESNSGGEANIGSAQLCELLRQHPVPLVTLNACRSAMPGPESADPFSSVAAALLKIGIRTVSMGYGVRADGARCFMSAFYEALFLHGSLADAVQAGRRRMWESPERVCARGRIPLQDWLVPVLYQQHPLDFDLSPSRPKPARRRQDSEVSRIPEEAVQAASRLGLVGRDAAILSLERVLRRREAGILVQGLGGVGKTALAAGLLDWLEATGSEHEGYFWFHFADIPNAEFVFDRMVETLSGIHAAADELDVKLQAIVEVFRRRPYLIVWDNFESLSGHAGSPDNAFAVSDRQLLIRFLASLNGGASKVLITSRSREEWLGENECRLVPLSGLVGEERWEYCAAVLHELNLEIDQEDPDVARLIDQLEGHPLAMWAILPRLAEMSASKVIEALQSNLGKLKQAGNAAEGRLFATLKLVHQSLPWELHPLLNLLELHQRFLDVDDLLTMAQGIDRSYWRPERINRFVQALADSGLLHRRIAKIYEIHPVVVSYLRSNRAEGKVRQAWVQVFTDLMGRLANDFISRPLDEQRAFLGVHGAHLPLALKQAKRLRMESHFIALASFLAFQAQISRNYRRAGDLTERMLKGSRRCRNLEAEANALHRMGRIAEEQLDLDSAGKWYRRSLAVEKKRGNPIGISGAYHQLGMLAEEQQNWNKAEEHYHQSLAIREEFNDEKGAAKACLHLGRIAGRRQAWDEAAAWCNRSLSLAEQADDQKHLASTYHVLGWIEHEQQHWDQAERFYRKSLAIKKRLNDEEGFAKTANQLGILAYRQGNWENAEFWYRDSIHIEERRGDQASAARTYVNLGNLAVDQGRFEEGGQWALRSLMTGTGDPPLVRKAINSYLRCHYKAAHDQKARLQAMWEEAELGSLNWGKEGGTNGQFRSAKQQAKPSDKTLYIETSIFAWLASPLASGLESVRNQSLTWDFWDEHREEFNLVVSKLVLQELGSRDPSEVQSGLRLTSGIPTLELDERCEAMAESLVGQGALPRRLLIEAIHLAAAARHGIPYLLTWDFRGIANAELQDGLTQACREHGYQLPTICTRSDFALLNDPIVEEIRRIREEYAARFRSNLERIFTDIREQSRISRSENRGA